MSTWRTKYIADKLAARTFKKYHGYNPKNIPDAEMEHWQDGVAGVLGVYRKTRKPCSCFCCGNPRKFLGNSKHAKTRQELLSCID